VLNVSIKLYRAAQDSEMDYDIQHDQLFREARDVCNAAIQFRREADVK